MAKERKYTMELRVTADFEGGNGRVERILREEQADVVYFAAEHKKGGPQALWFFLRLEGVKGPHLQCVLTNPSQILGGGGSWKHNSPVVRFGSGTWSRIGQVTRRLNEHLVPEIVMEIEVPPGESVAEIAACYPYLRKDLEATFEDADPRSIWSKCGIGYSADGNSIIRVYNTLGDEERSKPGLFFIARQHAGETPGSWALDGILRYLVSDEGLALSKELCIWAVPVADPDGVACGAYGKDQFPWDINRAWDRVTRPEIRAIQTDLIRWSGRCRPHMIVDLHAPGYSEHGFYFWAPTVPHSVARLTHTVANLFRERVPEHLRGNEPAYRPWGATQTSVHQGSSCIAFGIQRLGIPTATLEISYQGPEPGVWYTPEDYRLLGRTLIETLHSTLPG
jgi:hypothetical protein